MSRTILQDGQPVTLSDADFAVEFPAPPPAGPQIVFPSDTLIETLFTPAEQAGFESKAQGALFATLIAGAGQVDITSPTFRADIAQAVAGGFLTQARAAQVLAGTPAPQGS